MTARAVIVAAALLGASAVALGAFGAHALAATLDERALAIWRTAVDYQFWHALAALAAGSLTRDRAARAASVAAIAFVAGIVLFSGSLYALALGAPRVIGVATPIGGVALIAGWLALAWSVWRDEGLR